MSDIEIIDPDHNLDSDVQVLKLYMTTLQTCERCGVCFQNRGQIYQGRRPCCRRCRPRQRQNVYVVKYQISDGMAEFREQYIIPVEDISPETLASLESLHNTTVKLISVKDESGFGITQNIYENPSGSLFHEKFSRENYTGTFNIRQHKSIKMFQYAKVVVPKQKTD